MSYAIKELRLYYTAGGSDKEYRVVVEAIPGGYKVYGRNGRRGSALALQPKLAGPVNLAQAERELRNVAAEKEKKGYTTNFSGRPGSGVFLATAEVTYAAPAAAAPAAPAPIPPELSADLVPAAWVNAGPQEADLLLDGAALSSAQLLPEGERLMVVLHAPSAALLALAARDGGPAFLPDEVEEELRAALSGHVLDGFYAAGVFVVCDGYCLGGRGAEAGFSERMAALEAALGALKEPPEHVRLQRAFYASDVPEAVYRLAGAGSRVLVRRGGGPYARPAARRLQEPYAYALTMD